MKNIISIKRLVKLQKVDKHWSNMAFIFFIALMCGFNLNVAHANDGHRIEVNVKNYTADYCFFTSYYGNKKYLIKDTLYRDDKGKYVIEGDEPLNPGLYAILLPPQNIPFELMISDEKDQKFTVETDTSNVIKNLKIKGSKENQAFYEYLHFTGEKRQEITDLQAEGEAEKNKKKKQKISDKIKALNGDISQYQSDYISTHQGWLSTAMLKASTDVKVPDPATEMTEEEESMYRMNYYRKHYFDNLDFSDERLLYSPVYFNKIDFYLKRLTYQIPDTLMQATDFILDKAKANDKIYNYTLFEFISRYGNSKVVGMDAVFVHLVDKYVVGKTFENIDEKQIAKIVKTAKEFKPLLIGKKAPNITLQNHEGENLALYDMDAEYTLLYFWDTECGHCKKAAPLMVDFYNKYKEKGVEMYAICTKDKNPKKCMDFIKEKDFDIWTNVLAMTDRQLYYRLYYRIKSTPVIYILDKDKNILMKNVGAKQLPDVMDAILAK